jgi:hypothetical protein
MIDTISWSIHYDGLAATFLKMILKFCSLVHLPLPGQDSLKNWIDKRFDSRFHVETSGDVEVGNLDISEDEKEEAVEYTSTPATLGSVLSILNLDYSKYIFIDYGCGKGKALFMASYFPFWKIMGVEISRMLCDAANRNIETFQNSRSQCTQFEVHCSDAKSFDLPEEPLVLYFYNPFSEVVMKEVLDSVQASFLEFQREIYLIYYNPKHKDLMNQMKKFEQIDLERWDDPMWVIYKSDVSDALKKID